MKPLNQVYFFAIRRKSDKAFLPAYGKRRGHTSSEPSLTAPPRLYRLESHAKAALKWWLAGVTTVTTYDYETGDEDWNTKAVPGRNAEDMEVVLLELKDVLT